MWNRGTAARAHAHHRLFLQRFSTSPTSGMGVGVGWGGGEALPALHAGPPEPGQQQRVPLKVNQRLTPIEQTWSPHTLCLRPGLSVESGLGGLLRSWKSPQSPNMLAQNTKLFLSIQKQEIRESKIIYNLTAEQEAKRSPLTVPVPVPPQPKLLPKGGTTASQRRPGPDPGAGRTSPGRAMDLAEELRAWRWEMLRIYKWAPSHRQDPAGGRQQRGSERCSERDPARLCWL